MQASLPAISIPAAVDLRARGFGPRAVLWGHLSGRP